MAESFDQTEGINRKRHASDCSGNHIHLAKRRKKHPVQTARRRMVNHHRKERGKLQHQFGHNSPSFPTVAESGIRTAEDVTVLRQAGVNGVLVGETLMRSPD